MTPEMPRDTTLLRLREPFISRLDIVKASAYEIKERLRHDIDSTKFILSVFGREVVFERTELEVALAYLHLSKQL